MLFRITWKFTNKCNTNKDCRYWHDKARNDYTRYLRVCYSYTGAEENSFHLHEHKLDNKTKTEQPDYFTDAGINTRQPEKYAEQ